MTLRTSVAGPSRGVTLVELMVVVAIVAILATIAYPSYMNHVRKSHRTIAKTTLMSVASRQESFRADRRRYATSLTELGLGANTVYAETNGDLKTTNTTDAIYAVTLTGASATAFTITATPIRVQESDARCGTFSLTATGERSASGSDGIACWR